MFEFLRIGRHGRLRELLSAYVDGQVSASEASRVQEHLAACAECRRELEALRATVSLLRSLPQVQPSRSFALAEAPEPADRRWPVAWGARAAMSVAGLVLAALLVGDAVGLVRQATGREPSLAAMEAEVVVEKEVIKEAPVEVVVEKEVIKEVPVEVVVTQEVIKEVPVEVVVTQEVVKEVPVEVVVTQEVVKEVPVEGGGDPGGHQGGPGGGGGDPGGDQRGHGACGDGRCGEGGCQGSQRTWRDGGGGEGGCEGSPGGGGRL